MDDVPTILSDDSVSDSDEDIDGITAAACTRILRASASHTSGTGSLHVADAPGQSGTSTGGQSPAADDHEPNSDSESNGGFADFVIDSKPNLDFASDNDIVYDTAGSRNTRDGSGSGEMNDENEEEVAESDVINSLRVNEKSKPKTNSEKNKKLGEHRLESTIDLTAPCEIDVGLDLGDSYINLDGEDPSSSKTAVETILLKSQQDKLIKKSVLTPDYEKQHSIPQFKVAARQLKRDKKKARESTKGDGWFGMKAPEMTEQLRNDIKVVRMRSTLDPKRFYKGNDMTAIPKFVQVGTVIDNPVDFYHSRVPKKQRKETIVDELLADADSRRYNKRKYMELQERFNSKSGNRKHWKKRGGKKR